MNRKNVTVFDFDGTLTHDDTFISFSRYALGAGHFVKGLLQAFPWLLAWKIRLISGSIAKEKLYSFLFKGISKSYVIERARDFKPVFREDILSLVKMHIELGDTVYILSASLDLWMEDIAKKLGVNVICTTTSVDVNGILDGCFSSANCRGKEKIRRLLAKESDGIYLTVYGNEPAGGDASLFKIADKSIIISDSKSGSNCLTSKICKGLEQVKKIQDGKLPRKSVKDFIEES